MKDSQKTEYTVIYWNMENGPVYRSDEYINKYDSLPEDDNEYRIPKLKVGQTTYCPETDGTGEEGIVTEL